MFTYSLGDIAAELFSEYRTIAPKDDDLLRLWYRNNDLIDYFPEEFWAFEHIKVIFDLQIKLLEMYDNDSPYCF